MTVRSGACSVRRIAEGWRRAAVADPVDAKERP